MRELGLVKASDMRSGTEGSDSDSAPRGARGGAAAATAAAAAAARRRSGALPSFLEGWERVGDLAWSRTIRRACGFPGTIDATPFARISARPGAGAPAPASAFPLALGAVESERLRFFDFETTGLSGGTGTIAFLAAVGRLEDGELAVRQLFLEDYPGEPAFLEALLGEFDEDSVIATYNGSSFDLPLLRTRCVMNGMSAPRRPHLDALFAARRLWKRVFGSASLGRLERELLGVEREADVPGSMIPGLYFSFLRKGEEPLMPVVMSHNADDAASLARLVARADSIFAEPRAQAGSSCVDRAGLGRSLIAAGRAAEGEELLEAALGDGDEAAGLLLSRRYRREGRGEERARVVEMLPDAFRSDMERAKYFERSAKDLRSALEWAAKARRLAATEAESEAAGIRIARLRRRLARDEG
jgi:uncharacterized protein YprB with RNaseH-like and TPR domain